MIKKNRVFSVLFLLVIFNVPSTAFSDLVPVTATTQVPAPVLDAGVSQNQDAVKEETSPETTDFFAQSFSLSAEEPCTAAMCGITSGDTMSGTIFVQPNLELNPDIRKVAYYLNGTLSGREYNSPFTWGGGAGFDTTKLQNGSYILSGAYTTRAGDTNFSISFTVDNSNQTPDTAPPVISAVSVSNVTPSGAAINWTTDETSDSQVQYREQGTTAWSETVLNTSFVTNHSVTISGLKASTVYQYQAKSKDPAGNLAVQAMISTFTTANVNANGDFTGVTDGATLSGTINIGPNLALHPGIRKVAYYLNGTKSGKVYASPFYWGGTAGDGTAGFDTAALSDGTHTLSMTYTDNTGDHTISVTFNVNNTEVNPVAVYMLGDSITRGNDWAFALGRDDVINGGVSGERTYEFLARIQDVYDAAPEIVLVMGGINDLRGGAAVAVTYDYYIQIVEGISSRGIRPVIQSTLHVREIERTANQKVTELNLLLRDYALGASLDYLDLDEYFSVDGHIRPEYTYDGVHLNSAAYDIWEPEVLALLELYGI